MKFNGIAILSLFSLVSGSVARRGHRFGSYEESDPVEEKSHVTAFINGKDGLRVECWEVGDLLHQRKGSVRHISMGNDLKVGLYTFAPNTDIVSIGQDRDRRTSVDFRNRPNLFTIKEGLVLIEAMPNEEDRRNQRNDIKQYVFAGLNGDDWFYFEDEMREGEPDVSQHCANPMGKDYFNARTVSGSDTTLISFQYEESPRHKVLHEGRCKFAGLKPISEPGQKDPDSGRRLRTQEL